MLSKIISLAFKEYVLRYKMRQAAQTLEETDSRIIEIAMQYGFSSHEAFTRAFRKVFHCSPSQYRLQKSLDVLQVQQKDKRG